jgi:hypothetical protein
VVVTLFGWLILAKGLLLLLLSPEALTGMMQQIRYEDHFRWFLAPALVMGFYLTWAGFTAPARDR